MEFYLKNRTIANYATVIHRSIHGKVSEQPTYYNLDIIISVGYPVNSIQATRFHQWTPNTLKEYMHFRKAHTGGASEISFLLTSIKLNLHYYLLTISISLSKYSLNLFLSANVSSGGINSFAKSSK